MKKLIGILVFIMIVGTVVGCTQNTIKHKNQIDDLSGDNTVQTSGDLEIENVDSGEKNEESGDVIESQEETLEVEVTPVSTSNLSNTVCAWGFVRKKDAVQPEIYGPYSKVLNTYDGIYMGNSNDKRIYLTFDEGYENGYTASILDTLKEKNVTAAFFVTMPYVKQNEALIQRMIDEGHIVGNHTVNHPSMPEVTDDAKLEKEVMDLHNYMVENFKYEMTYLRPPKGEYSERTVKLCKDLGYTHVLWSSAYDDWDVNNQKGHDYAKKMILNYSHNGCVMLLHAVSKDNTEVLGEIIDSLREKEYEFYSLDNFER
ncbi:MAG: polysaccharide deacetylase family protein [Clostridia bacterium]|nr:polysaccharide deacetylase family protein [Clostridia bacterium]